MPQYLITGYLPDDFDPSAMDEAVIEGIHALNHEMIAAGIRRFAGGLGPATSLRAQPNGEVIVTDGPYLETKEHVGGLSIVETPNLDEAVEWAVKGAKVGRMPNEVRETLFHPAAADTTMDLSSIGRSGKTPYVVAIYLPDDYDPSAETEATIEGIHALNREMIDADVRRFACGLGPTRTVSAQANGEVLVTDGPYLETKEHVGGFWILETESLAETLEWGRKALKACRAPVEVRQIFFMPAPEES
jgi:hypothetical protein